MRNVFSSVGISSVMIASPYGPAFAEFTQYELSKYGVGCSIVTRTARGKSSDVHAL